MRDNGAVRNVSSTLSGVGKAISQRSIECVSLAGVIAAAVALAVLWVYMVPMLEASDESEHFDYVLALAHAGRLLPGRPVMNPILQATADEETRLFETYADFYRVTLNKHDRVPAGYGTHQYFKKIDREADASLANHKNDWDDPQRPKPGLIDLYPFGYYFANAAWLRIFSFFDRSQVALFFAARWFSVALLAVTLVFVYRVARELRLAGWFALALTAVVGMHSLTTFVASYVQPDNMALSLISVILYLSLRILKNRMRVGTLLALSAALAILAVTKYQFFVCVSLVVAVAAAIEISRPRRPWVGRLILILVLALPSVVMLGLQHVVIGTDDAYIQNHLGNTIPVVRSWQAFGVWIAIFGSLIVKALYHFFVGGFNSELESDPHYSGSVSYWGNSGWLDTPLSFGNAYVDTGVHVLIQTLNVSIIVLTAIWVGRSSSRLIHIARRGKHWVAMRLVAASVPINLYFVFIAFMAIFYAVTNNAWRLSGRNWLPVVEPAFLLGVWYAPRALVARRLRVFFGLTVLALLALYASIGSYYAALSVHDRYYGLPYTPPLAALERGRTSDISIQRLYSAPMYSAVDARTFVGTPVAQGNVYHVAGWAVDIDRRRAAGGVIALIDGRDEFAATYGYSNVPVAEQLHNFLYYWAGYHFFIPTNNLSIGLHSVEFFIVSSDLKRYFPTLRTLHFFVVPPTLPQPYRFTSPQRITGSIERLGSDSQRSTDDSLPVWLATTDTLSMQGWLLNQTPQDRVVSVFATVDGSSRYPARLHVPRLDLLRQFPSLPPLILAYAGFAIELPLHDLAGGPHRVALSARSRSGRIETVVDNFPFTTHLPRTHDERIDTAGIALPAAFGDGRTITGYVDQISSLDLATDYSLLAGPVWLSRDSTLFMRGWALDLVRGGALRDLWVDIDGAHRFPVRPGGLRVDVPKAYPSLPWSSTYYSGFTLALPMQQYRTGPHTLTLWGSDSVTRTSRRLVSGVPFTTF